MWALKRGNKHLVVPQLWLFPIFYLNNVDFQCKMQPLELEMHLMEQCGNKYISVCSLVDMDFILTLPLTKSNQTCIIKKQKHIYTCVPLHILDIHYCTLLNDMFNFANKCVCFPTAVCIAVWYMCRVLSNIALFSKSCWVIVKKTVILDNIARLA